MLSPTSRERIQNILSRVAKGELVSLEERVFIHQIADKDQSVNSWLKRARRIQQKEVAVDSIDEFLGELDLGSIEPNSIFNPEQEDLGDWFTGAPSWLGRS